MLYYVAGAGKKPELRCLCKVKSRIFTGDVY